MVSPTAATFYFYKSFWSVLRSKALETPQPGFRELIGRKSCWTWPGSAPKPPRPSPEPSPEPSAPRWRTISFFPGPCRCHSSRLGSIAWLLSAPCWRIISFSKQFILRFAAAKNKKRVVSRNGCEIDSSRVRVAVTLSGLVPLRRYAQIHVVASSHPPSLSKPNVKTQNNRVSEFYQHMVLRKQAWENCWACRLRVEAGTRGLFLISWKTHLRHVQALGLILSKWSVMKPNTFNRDKFLKTLHFEVCSSRKQEKSGSEKRLWDRLLPGLYRYYSSRLVSIASLLSAPCWRVIPQVCPNHDFWALRPREPRKHSFWER